MTQIHKQMGRRVLPNQASVARVIRAAPDKPIKRECPVPPALGEMLEGDMSERRITQLFGLILGAIFTFSLVLNAFAF